MRPRNVEEAQMFQQFVRMTAAAVAAGVIAFAITAPPVAIEHSVSPHAAQQAPPTLYAKSDRLRVPARGAACSLHGWPNFEPNCQFKVREPAGEARTVRVIAIR